MARQPSKAAAKAMGKAKAAGKLLKGETGILRHLAAEHGEVAGLMKRVAGSDDVDLRADLFPDIYRKLLSHAQAEEAEFYPMLRGIGLTDLVDRSLEQHREVEQLLEQLHDDDESSPEWSTLFARMKEAVERHVALEENEIFPVAADKLGGEELKEMLGRYERAQEMAEQRLH
jgi:hemerythrin superfamily protein